MADILNLRRARKAKTRAANDKRAQANRLFHGTPKHLRNLAQAQKDKTGRDLSGHKLQKPRDDN